jgi:hypothetical protein
MARSHILSFTIIFPDYGIKPLRCVSRVVTTSYSEHLLFYSKATSEALTEEAWKKRNEKVEEVRQSKEKGVFVDAVKLFPRLKSLTLSSGDRYLHFQEADFLILLTLLILLI